MTTIEAFKPAHVIPGDASDAPTIGGLGESLVTKQSLLKAKRELGWLATMTEIVDPNLHLVEAARLIREGAYPIIYSNHTQHANISGFIEVVKALRSARPEKIYVPIARSLVNQDESAGGNQASGFIEFAQAAAPLLERHGMFFVPVPRTKDVNMLLGMTTEEAEQAIGKPLSKEQIAEMPEVMEIIREGRKNKRFMLGEIKNDSGIALFPEETTWGGIEENPGEYNGIGEVPNSMLPDAMTRALKLGRDIVLINLGMNGYTDVVPARKAEYDKSKVVRWVIRESIANHLGVYLGKSPIRVTVGKPLTWDDLRRDGVLVNDGEKNRLIPDKEVNDYCMSQVAKVVDPELRGKYK